MGTAPTATCTAQRRDLVRRATTPCRSPPGPTSTPTPTARWSASPGPTAPWNMPFLSVNGLDRLRLAVERSRNRPDDSPLRPRSAPRCLAPPGHHLRSERRRHRHRQEIFYVDGDWSPDRPPAPIQPAPGPPTSSPPTSPARSPTAASWTALLGKVDEVRAYNRTLSAARRHRALRRRGSPAAPAPVRPAPAARPPAAAAAPPPQRHQQLRQLRPRLQHRRAARPACGGPAPAPAAPTAAASAPPPPTIPTTAAAAASPAGCRPAPPSTAASLDTGSSTKGPAPPRPIPRATATRRLSPAPTWTTGYSGEAVAGDGSSNYVSANLGT